MTRPAGSRDRVLACAREMFYQVGYHSTSVDDVLKGCGVAKSNFYYHFESKEALATAVLDQRIAEFETLLSLTLSNPMLSPVLQLRSFLEAVCEAHSSNKLGGCPLGNFAASLANDTAEAAQNRFRTSIAALFDRLFAAAEACLALGAARGEFRGDVAPAQLATVLVAGVQGLLLVSKTRQDAGYASMCASALIALFQTVEQK